MQCKYDIRVKTFTLKNRSKTVFRFNHNYFLSIKYRPVNIYSKKQTLQLSICHSFLTRTAASYRSSVCPVAPGRLRHLPDKYRASPAVTRAGEVVGSTHTVETAVRRDGVGMASFVFNVVSYPCLPLCSDSLDDIHM